MDRHSAIQISFCLVVISIILVESSIGRQCEFKAKVAELKLKAQIMLKENCAKSEYTNILMERLDKLKTSALTDIKTLKEEIKSKRNKLNLREGNLLKLSNANHELAVKNGVAINKRKSKQKVPKAIQQNSTNPVSFTAVMDTHKENLAIHQTVKFDRVITNNSSGFDLHSSIFKAPIAGLYYFAVVIMTHNREDIETEIVKNGIPIVNTYSGDSTTWNAGSQSTVLNLNIGDTVYIRILNNPAVNDKNVRVFGYGWSSFSGFLISK